MIRESQKRQNVLIVFLDVLQLIAQFSSCACKLGQGLWPTVHVTVQTVLRNLLSAKFLITSVSLHLPSGFTKHLISFTNVTTQQPIQLSLILISSGPSLSDDLPAENKHAFVYDQMGNVRKV